MVRKLETKTHLLKLPEALGLTLGVLFGGPCNAEGPMETIVR